MTILLTIVTITPVTFMEHRDRSVGDSWRTRMLPERADVSGRAQPAADVVHVLTTVILGSLVAVISITDRLPEV